MKAVATAFPVQKVRQVGSLGSHSGAADSPWGRVSVRWDSCTPRSCREDFVGPLCWRPGDTGVLMVSPSSQLHAAKPAEGDGCSLSPKSRDFSLLLLFRVSLDGACLGFQWPQAVPGMRSRSHSGEKHLGAVAQGLPSSLRRLCHPLPRCWPLDVALLPAAVLWVLGTPPPPRCPCWSGIPCQPEAEG